VSTSKERRTLTSDLLDLMRDVAAEELHGARLARDLGARLLDATLGSGTADELKADAIASLAESADALRRATAANLALARAAVAAKGRATDWLAAVIEAWLAKGQDGKPPPPPRERPSRDDRRARLATLLDVIGELRRTPSRPAAPVAAAGPDAVIEQSRAGGAATVRLRHEGADEVRAGFLVGPCAPVGGGASFRALVLIEPEELTLRPQVEESVRVAVPWDERFVPGTTYRLPITVAGLGRQLVIHIVAVAS
jgi:hypothetical protein